MSTKGRPDIGQDIALFPPNIPDQPLRRAEDRALRQLRHRERGIMCESGAIKGVVLWRLVGLFIFGISAMRESQSFIVILHEPIRMLFD